MTPALCALMAEYNRWMNARLYAAAAQLPQARLFEDRGAFFGSLFGTLNHIAVADLIWLRRFIRHHALSRSSNLLDGFPGPTSLTQPVAQSLPELGDLRTRLDAVIIGLANLVTDELLADTIRYSNTAGQQQAKNFGLLLQHFFNHQTHHRGQASTLLFQAGVDVGVTDLNALIANEGEQP
jgi:uncharacterized damage-inducible protein DinB